MISGKTIQLRGITKADAPLIYKWVNMEELRDLTGTLYPVSEYEHEKWIENVTLSSDKKLFSVYHSDKCIGTIGIKNINYISSNAELFISLGESGVPYAGTDAVNTLVEYCFSHLNFHKIYLHVFASNTRAIKCYKNAGFEVEGVLREHHFSNGAYEDVYVMGRINESL